MHHVILCDFQFFYMLLLIQTFDSVDTRTFNCSLVNTQVKDGTFALEIIE